jgi:hypothetical protein
MLLRRPDKSDAGSEFCLSWPALLPPSRGMCHCLLAIELERRLARQRLRLKPRSVEHRNTNQGGEFLSLDPLGGFGNGARRLYANSSGAARHARAGFRSKRGN